MGSTQIIIKKRKRIRRREETDDVRGKVYFYFFSFRLSLFFLIYGNRIVGIRRGKKQSVVLDEGYA